MPRDLPRRILRKISVPIAPFSCRLVPTPAATVVRKIFAQLFGQFQGAVFEVFPNEMNERAWGQSKDRAKATVSLKGFKGPYDR